MGYAYVTVTDQSGAINLLYASITWSGSSGSTTVYVNVEGVNSAGAAWRVRKGTSTPLQGSGIGEKSFTGTIGQTYQLQAVDPNTSNWAWYGGNFTLTADSSSGGGGDDGGDDGGDSGGTYYLWIKDVDHVKTKVYRYSGGDYPLVSEGSFFESSDDDGLWYGLEINNPSYFRFDFEVDSGYTLTNQGIYNLSWDSSDQDWAFRGGEDPYVWPEVSKNSGSGSGGSTTPSLPNVSTTQSVYAFIDNGSVWIPVGADAASLGLAKVSQTEIAYALVDSGSSWLPINY